MYYERIYDFDNLYKAFLLARRGKRWKHAVAKFEVNLVENLIRLQDELKSNTYKPGEYYTFKVYEPKERDVMTNAFRDKVVQHSLCDNALEPLTIKHLILDNAASQRGKGTHFALDRLENAMHSFYRRYGTKGWVLKCDIRKYFYSIPHDYLKQVLRPLIPEDDLWWLICMIIDSTDDPGIPIGNQSSQLLAVLALSPLDHFIKEKLQIKYYGRYQDDFYLIHHDKEYLKQCLRDIQSFLKPKDMVLNQKTQIFPLKNGLDFLGFHFYLTESGKVVRKLRHRSKTKMVKKLRKFRKLLDEGNISMETINQSYQSWRGHAKHGDCYHLMSDMDRLYHSLFNKKEETQNGTESI